jgi:signal transduction histidine kinase
VRPIRLLRTTSFRLSALYAVLFGASVLVLIGIIYWFAIDALREQLIAAVDGEVAALAEADRAGGAGRAAEAIERRLTSGRRLTSFYLLQDRGGAKLAGNIPRMAPVTGWIELPVPAQGDNDEDPADGHRLLARGAWLADGGFLLVGVDTYRLTELREAILAAFGWGLTVTILLAAIGGAALSAGFLRRIEAINRTARAIIDGRLGDRVPARGTRDELDQLAQNFNAMLDRIQALMESLRQVSSDIAHDLRSPLSRLRQRLEAARAAARSAEDYETAVDQAIAEADSILATFAALLRIAQIEAGTRKAAFAALDLSEIFQHVADAYAAVAEDRGQRLLANIAAGLPIHGDRELLIQMLANLVENAIRHTPAGTTIAIGLESAAGGALARVSDNGPGIPADARAKVFRRFYRLEASRTSPGSGLGLALVAAVAELHRIRIELADNGPGLRVSLFFPKSSSHKERDGIMEPDKGEPVAFRS